MRMGAYSSSVALHDAALSIVICARKAFASPYTMPPLVCCSRMLEFTTCPQSGDGDYAMNFGALSSIEISTTSAMYGREASKARDAPITAGDQGLPIRPCPQPFAERPACARMPRCIEVLGFFVFRQDVQPIFKRDLCRCGGQFVSKAFARETNLATHRRHASRRSGTALCVLHIILATQLSQRDRQGGLHPFKSGSTPPSIG